MKTLFLSIAIFVLLASPAFASRTQDQRHNRAHHVTSKTTTSLGIFISRDLENGPTMFGGELMIRPGRRLGLRMSLAGGDGVVRSAVDALYFGCPKPVQLYAGLGFVFDCGQVEHDGPPTVTAVPTSEPTPIDPPRLIAGIQGRNQAAPFLEAQVMFGKRRVTPGVEGGLRWRF